jgi:hypothetical protein
MDEADIAQELIDRRVAEAIARATEKPMDPGVPGECELCGEESARLVQTTMGLACAACRDRRRLP